MEPERVRREAIDRPFARELKQLIAFARRPVVLLVEDDADMRRYLAALLRRELYRVIEAADGDEALERLDPWAREGKRDAAPELIVADVHLPCFSGLEILESVQVAERPVPVILITGFPDLETTHRALALGAAFVLAKPFEPTEFRRAVAEALHRPPEAR